MLVSANDTEYMNSLAEDAPAYFSGAEMKIVFQFDPSEGKEEVSPPSSCSSLANNAPRSELWTPAPGWSHSILYLFTSHPWQKGMKKYEPTETEPQKPPFLLI